MSSPAGVANHLGFGNDQVFFADVDQGEHIRSVFHFMLGQVGNVYSCEKTNKHSISTDSHCCAFAPKIVGKLPKNTISRNYKITNKRLLSCAEERTCAERAFEDALSIKEKKRDQSSQVETKEAKFRRSIVDRGSRIVSRGATDLSLGVLGPTNPR